MVTQHYEIGDYRNLIHNIPNESIDLLVTDPNYDNLRVSGAGWDKQIHYQKKIKDINLDKFNVVEFLNLVEPKMKYFHAYIFCNKDSLSKYINWIEARKYNWNIIIMAKNNPIPAKNYKYVSDKEYVIFVREPSKCYWNNDLPIDYYRSVKTINIGKKLKHPTQKPLKIIKEFIAVSSKEGDLIFDPCMGYGTTMKACVDLNRGFIGYDILDVWKPYYKEFKKEIKLGKFFRND